MTEKRKYKKWTRREETRLMSLWNKGKSVKEISKIMDISEGVVSPRIYWLRRQGHDVTRRSGGPIKSYKGWTDNDYKTLLDLWEDGKLVKEIAEEMGRTVMSINQKVQALRDAGIPVSHRFCRLSSGKVVFLKDHLRKTRKRRK